MSRHTDDVLKFSREIRDSLIELQNEEIEYQKSKANEIKEAAKTVKKNGPIVHMDIPNPPISSKNKINERELEMKFIDVSMRVAEFGRVFLTSATKEEFAESILNGALDPQEAGHKLMQLVKRYYSQDDSKISRIESEYVNQLKLAEAKANYWESRHQLDENKIKLLQEELRKAKS
jgi:hypothetical protein